jgi:hypothetical protein
MHVVVSHFHTDHVGDLPALLFALKNAARPSRTTPLTLIGPVGLRAFLRALADVLGEHLVSPGFDLRVVEVAPGTPFAESGGAFVLDACATPHTPESLAYRLSGAWGAVGYTGDTGPSEEVARFLAACDVLVGECAQSDPPSHDRHLSPALLADFAAVARPGLLEMGYDAGPSPESSAPRSASSATTARWTARQLEALPGVLRSSTSPSRTSRSRGSGGGGRSSSCQRHAHRRRRRRPHGRAVLRRVREQILDIAHRLREPPGHRPPRRRLQARTSPYAFQGLGV